MKKNLLFNAKTLFFSFLLMLVYVAGWGQTDNLACPAGTIVSNQMIFTTTNFTIVHSKGTDTNFASYSPWRVYTDNTVTFTGGANVKYITSIVITASSTAYATAAVGGILSITSGTGTISGSASGSIATITLTGTDVKGVYLKPNAQSRWSSITINYVPASTPPSIAFSAAHPAAANITQNTNNNIIGGIKLDVTTADATLTGVSLTTAGTYTSSDIKTNGFKIWLAPNANNLTGATQLGADQAAVGNGGTVAVSGLNNTITSGNYKYILLTANIASGATANNTLRMASTAFANVTFSSGTKTGTNPVAAGATPGNDQTIIASTTPVLAISGTPTNHGSVCVGASASSVQYTITNSGSVQADDVTVTSSDGQFVVSDLSSTSIAASGGTATYNVTFTPASSGAKTATITVASTTSGSNSPTSSLSGTGVAAATQAVTSSAATDVTGTTATLNGNVTTLGVCPASNEKGFVYAVTATNNDPLVGGTGVTKTPVAGVTTGAYTLGLTGLATGTNYTFKAYIYNGTTYTYGATLNFTTLSPPANDLCANAVNLVVNDPATNGTLISSTASSSPFTSYKDVWYKFTPSCTGSHTITVTGFTGDVDVHLFNQSSSCPTTVTTIGTASTTNSTETITTNLTSGITYYVRVYAYDATAEVSNFTIRVTTALAPLSTPGAISGNSSVCEGTSNTYSISSIAGATSYTWTLPGGWSGTSTTNSITTTAGATGGTISVTANNGCGASSPQTLNVDVSAPPSTPATPISNSPQCLPTGVTVQYATGQSAPAGETWYWQTTATGMATDAVNSAATYNVTTSGTSTIYLRSKNSSGCWSAASSVSVTVNAVTAISTHPANQSATVGGTATFTVVAAGAGLSYQWQVDKNDANGFNAVTDGTGGNTASYTTIATTLAMNGYKYRVIVTGTCGSAVTSTGATLTVTTVVYVNGDYQTNPAFTGGIYYFNSHTADGSGNYPWQKRNGSNWEDVTTSGGAPQNLVTKPPTIYLNGYYIDVAGGSNTPYNNIVIEGSSTNVYSGNTSNGLRIATGKTIDLKAGELNVTGYMSLQGTAKLHVYANADFKVASSSGIFLRDASSVIEIDDDGNFYVNSYLENLWTGTEKFHKNSNFYIQDWNNGSSVTLFVSNPVSPTTESGKTACFGNLIIDMSGSSTGQALQFFDNNFSGYLTHNDLIFKSAPSTGSMNVRFFHDNTGCKGSATIGRDLIIESAWPTKHISLTNSFTTTPHVTMTIKGNLENKSSNAAVFKTCTSPSNPGTVTTTLNIDGNLSLSNTGIFNFNSNSSNTQPTVTNTVNLKGDLSVGANSILLNSFTGTNGKFNFTGTGDGSTNALTQSIDIASTDATRNQRIDFLVNPLPSTVPYVQLSRNLELNTNSTFTVESNGTLDFGFNGSTALNIVRTGAVNGTAFELKDSGTLKITSPDGISSGNNVYIGNVQVGADATKRIFGTAGIYHYIGKTNQVTGNGLPDAAGGKRVIVELENNTNEFWATPVTSVKRFDKNGWLEIRKGIVKDGQNPDVPAENYGRFADAVDTNADVALQGGNLKMTGGRYILYHNGFAMPHFSGSYAFTGGVIQFDGNNQSIRAPKTYLTIEVTGKNVGTPAGNITLSNVSNPPISASLTIKNGGSFLINSNSIVGAGSGSKTVKIESGGIFRTGDEDGFSGSNVTSIQPSVNIDLQQGSTVEYSRMGDQVITSQSFGAAPDNYNYQNLSISGSGTKSPSSTTTDLIVNGMTTMPVTNTATPTLLMPSNTNFYALGGINNSNGATGKFILSNDANLLQHTDSRNDAVNTNAVVTVEKSITPRVIEGETYTGREYNYFISPVDAQKMKEIYGGDASNAGYIMELREPQGMFYNAYSGNYVKGKAYAVQEPKAGFVNGATTVKAEFSGKPANDNETDSDSNGGFTYNLAYSTINAAVEHGFNLVGNPYPSNLDLVELYRDSKVANGEPWIEEGTNPAVRSTFKFWDNRANSIYKQQGTSYKGYSYAEYNAAAGYNEGTGVAAPGNTSGANGDPASPARTKKPNYIVKVGQGFMAQALKPDAKLVFKNKQRTKEQEESQFYGRSVKTRLHDDRYWIELVNPGGLILSNAVVYFQGGNSGFTQDDSAAPTNTSDALYTLAEATPVLINGRAPFTNSDNIIIGTRHFLTGSYTFKLEQKEGVFANGQSVYLKDKELGIVTDLSHGSYTFSSDAGEFTNRFELTYKPETVLGTDATSKEGLHIYKEGEFIVLYSQRSALKQVELYDLSGRLLEKLMLNNKSKEARFNSLQLVDGVYVLKATLKDGEVITKKTIK